MRRFSIGRVIAIRETTPQRQEILVALPDGKETPAMVYPPLTGTVHEGDEVLLNIVALTLSLGTGGYHFVVADLSRPGCEAPDRGHIMKLRYTPMQINVLAAEEEGSPLREALLKTEDLDGLPVLLCPLHSFLAPAAAGVKVREATAKVAFLMTDSAALPLGFSKLVTSLKGEGLVDVTITCGQAFGGDVESVNPYTGLLSAKALGADVVIVAPGPGHVGTRTPLGFSGVEMGWLIDAVNVLKGKAVFVPRISFSDPRPRHRGISDHTITVLTRLCHTEAIVVFPRLNEEQEAMLREQLLATAIPSRHKIVWGRDGYEAIALLFRKGLEPESMGRKFHDDPALFLAPAAAALWVMSPRGR